MANREAFGVLWYSRVYHRLIPGWNIALCKADSALGMSAFQHRLEGEGAREWLEARGYRYCRNCERMEKKEGQA